MVSPAVASGNGPPQRNGFHENAYVVFRRKAAYLSRLCLYYRICFTAYKIISHISVTFFLSCSVTRSFQKTTAKSPLIFPFLHRSLKHLLFLHLRICSLLYQTIFQKQFFSLLFSAVYINKVRKSRQKLIFPSQLQSATIKKEGKINVKKGTTMTKTVQKSKARDMTQGSIWKQLLLFLASADGRKSLPAALQHR